MHFPDVFHFYFLNHECLQKALHLNQCYNIFHGHIYIHCLTHAYAHEALRRVLISPYQLDQRYVFRLVSQLRFCSCSHSFSQPNTHLVRRVDDNALQLGYYRCRQAYLHTLIIFLLRLLQLLGNNAPCQIKTECLCNMKWNKLFVCNFCMA